MRVRTAQMQSVRRKPYLINILLLEVGVLENLLHRLHRLTEKIHVEFLELSPGERLGEVVAVLE